MINLMMINIIKKILRSDSIKDYDDINITNYDGVSVINIKSKANYYSITVNFNYKKVNYSYNNKSDLELSLSNEDVVEFKQIVSDLNDKFKQFVNNKFSLLLDEKAD